MASASGSGGDNTPSWGSSGTSPADKDLSKEATTDNAGKPDDKGSPGDAETPGGQKPEDVEDRPNVSPVTPDDYPANLPDH